MHKRQKRQQKGLTKESSQGKNEGEKKFQSPSREQIEKTLNKEGPNTPGSSGL